MSVSSLQNSTDRKKFENSRRNLKSWKSSEKRKRSRSDASERSVKHRKRNNQ